jgi:hypothetical protein
MAEHGDEVSIMLALDVARLRSRWEIVGTLTVGWPFCCSERMEIAIGMRSWAACRRCSGTTGKLEVSYVERCVTLQLQGCVLNSICEVLSNGMALRQERHSNQLVPFVVRINGGFKNTKVWLHKV